MSILCNFCHKGAVIKLVFSSSLNFWFCFIFFFVGAGDMAEKEECSLHMGCWQPPYWIKFDVKAFGYSHDSFECYLYYFFFTVFFPFVFFSCSFRERERETGVKMFHK
ncbi:hypothetical protein PanWU01x14_349520 [Parasponia andersonii]|uniref:Uncharacterized protein n=1 Tax=Parasponia andersonii TaxID=3476 RepID=A0A2P5AB88_PARAD|nr:hypothetical protein PanWU01x14_349520 [Parasponia andersonii]